MSAGGEIAQHANVNLTPMIDMMVVLMIFLVKTYSVDPAYLSKVEGIDLATTTSETIAPNATVLFVGKDSILLDGQLVVSLKEGELIKSELDKSGLIPKLQNALTQMAEKTKKISESNDKVKFTGTLILQTDKSVPYTALRPILKTAGVSGYYDFKFAGIFN